MSALPILSLLAIGAIALANIRVSVLVINCPMFSSFQKFALCSIVWFVPLLGAVGIWAFVRNQYNWAKYDTRAFPEHSEKMVLVELANLSMAHLAPPVKHMATKKTMPNISVKAAPAFGLLWTLRDKAQRSAP